MRRQNFGVNEHQRWCHALRLISLALVYGTGRTADRYTGSRSCDSTTWAMTIQRVGEIAALCPVNDRAVEVAIQTENLPLEGK